MKYILLFHITEYNFYYFGVYFVFSFADQILKYQNKKDDEQQPFLDYVLDVTIAYPHGKPLDMGDIVTGWREPCRTYLVYRLYHSSEVSISLTIIFPCISHMNPF